MPEVLRGLVSGVVVALFVFALAVGLDAASRGLTQAVDAVERASMELFHASVKSTRYASAITDALARWVWVAPVAVVAVVVVSFLHERRR